MTHWRVLPVIIDFINALALLAGVAIAVWAIRSQRKTSAKRAALDFVSQFEVHAGPEWLKTVKYATQAIDNKEIWEPLVPFRPGTDKLSKKQVEQRAALFTWLNHYEAVATAVHSGALDRDFYLRWFGLAYKNYWRRAVAYVHFYHESECTPKGEKIANLTTGMPRFAPR